MDSRTAPVSVVVARPDAGTTGEPRPSPHDLVAPRVVGRYRAPSPGSIHDVAVAGDYVFLAQADFGIRVLAVRDLGAIRQVGAFATDGVTVLGARLALAGDVLFVASPELSLLAVDVADPTRPRPLGRLGAPVWWTRDVKVRASRAFLADGFLGIHIVDVGDPRRLVQVGCVPPAGAREKPAALEIQDDLVFVGSDFGGLSVLDVSEPSLPVYASRSFELGVFCNRLARCGNRLYFAGGFDKLHVLDISTPTSPAVVADYAEPATVEDVAVEGDSVFVLTFDFVEPAVQEMDFTVPAAPITKRAFVHQHVLQHIRVSRRRVFGLDGNEVVVVQF